jgi:DNA invertase Pin-like site-specific DNA recombinase
MADNLTFTSAASVQDCQLEAGMNTKYTILYQRLSRDDLLNGESMSIANQRAMLEEYAEKNGFVPFKSLCDDGFTGTNFNRPGWTELISEVESGNVSTILVKTLDRMGRDYLRMGLYREMFRNLGVRIVAIAEGYDSELGEDDFTPFKEIMAEWYARDTSRKIKSVVQSKGRSGKHVSSTPPYGFVKDEQDKNKWHIDPEAAEVVCRIFKMTVDGIGIGKIARILSEEKVERPSHYLGSRGRGRHMNDYDRDHPFAWGDATIAKILRTLEYCGHTVNFRTTTTDFKAKKRKSNDPDKWLIFYDTHDKIVDQETYDLVQKLRETPRRYDRFEEANPLTGLLWCADCGEKLYNHRKHLNAPPTHKKVVDVYHCSNYKLSKQKFKNECTAHSISTEAVREIILDILRKTSGYVREHETEFVEQVRQSAVFRRGETEKSYKKQISKAEKRLNELDRIYRSLYEDKALGRIEQEQFDEMSSSYNSERSELKTKIADMQAELDEYAAENSNVDRFVELVRRFTNFEELTAAMINEFIEKIIVHECEWSDGHTGENGRPRGRRTQQVDVYLKYIGKFDVPDLRTPEQIEADRIAEEKRELNRAYHRKKTREHLERKKAKLAEQNADEVKVEELELTA